ncbi:MAG: topoisomerase DNA-binding C4 zinc finger domain-containing protein [Nitrospirota bacterium]|nr:MAG: topoisomerase DNA-binding C4 zinc finger domain-containing protein [Nitrospirota bacterium]
MACSQYPDYKTTKPLELGVKCPSQECGGNLVQKRTKKGKNFYSCSKYPPCTIPILNKPINQPCPQCQSAFLIQKYKKQGTKVLCHNQESGYQEEEEEKIMTQQQTSQTSDAQKL